ncbi:MAG: peptide deformylase, partial [Clostridia bacterium]
MAKRMIVKEPDSILSKKCRAVEVFDDRLRALLDDMKETLTAVDGAGLAAPQVAVLKRAVIVSTVDGYFELINPILISASGEQTGIE